MARLSERVADYYREARWRTRRRKSAWNLLLFPLCFVSWLGLWYILFRFVWAFHVAIYPDHRFTEFWSPGISMGSFALNGSSFWKAAFAAVCLSGNSHELF